MSTITKVRLISQCTAAGTAVQIYRVEPWAIWAIWGCAATQGVVFYLPVLNSILFHASLP